MEIVNGQSTKQSKPSGILLQTMCDNSNYLPEDTAFIMGGINGTDGSTVSVSKNTAFDIADLSYSKHEEADTRIMAHLAYCLISVASFKIHLHIPMLLVLTS